MDKKKRSGGFSYIEALIAAAIVSLGVIPALSGFYAASANQRYAADRYEAAVRAEHLLMLLDRPHAAEETASEAETFLSDDKFIFIFNDAANPPEILSRTAPVIPVYENNLWTADDGSYFYASASGGALTLKGPLYEPADLRVPTVDAYDKNGNFLIRAGRAAR